MGFIVSIQVWESVCLKELIRKVRWLDVNQDGASGGDLGSLFVGGKLADEPWIDGLIFGSDVGSDVGPVDAEPLFGEIWSSGYGDVKVFVWSCRA